MSLRILMVLDHSFPPDARVENEAQSLVAGGHSVTILAVGPDDRPKRENYEGIQVIRDRMPEGIRNKMRGLAGMIPLMTWYLAYRIGRLHASEPFDVLHMHDLYLFGGGLRAAKRLGIPMVGDLHENWVEALKQYAWSSRYPGKLFVSIKRWEKLERRWINAVDRLIVVIEEAAERNMALGVPSDKITVVPNTVRLSEFDAYDVAESVAASVRSPLTLTYTGGFDQHRGLHSVIRAMPEILAAHPEAKLVLVGDGRIRSELEFDVERLGLAQSVDFRGWQPQELIKSFIAGSDICLVPHLRTPHTDATIPHKLFHYMYMRKPVLVSDCRPLERIVRETRAGVVYDAGNSSALADAALQLASDTDLMRDAGERGRQAVLKKYNWEHTARSMIGMYGELDR